MESVLLFQVQPNVNLNKVLQQKFELTIVSSINAVESALGTQEFRVLVCDQSQITFQLATVREILKFEAMAEIPLVLLSSSDDLGNKLDAFELGVDDFLESNTCFEEVCARISKSIFHRIANEQLLDRLNMANATAFTAMSDNSDLGANIQFLLGVNRCDNLDQLGQLLFSSLGRYGLSCSLQMRGRYETKSMEASGLAKDLESQLLMQMKDAGRYVDFGYRSIVNYGQASLLIRNMPLDDERRYGAVKDNTFALIQGVDARIKALDEHIKLLEEKEALKKLSQNVRSVMADIDDGYQEVMRTIVNMVEDMADRIQQRIPQLALSEEQEVFFESISSQCVKEANDTFAEGLHVDELFQNLSDSMDDAIAKLSDVEELPPHAEDEGEVLLVPMSGADRTVNSSAANNSAVNDDSVELF